VTDIVRGTTSRLTFDGAQHNSMPIWSPDGTQVAFASQRNGKLGIYKKAANNVGAYELLVESNTALLPESWSPDGRGIVYSELDPKMKGDLWLLPLSSSGATAAKPVALAHTPFSESFAEISPDGRWLAYASDETGRMEVYVRTFPDGSGKWAVSTNGGSTPHWRRDGRELFYLDRLTNGKIIGVSVDGTGSAFTVGPPRELLDSGFATLGHNAPYQPFSVSADGKRFLIPKTESVTATDALAAPIAVVLNWDSGLKK
jgi:Tol biopolymer transport system component